MSIIVPLWARLLIWGPDHEHVFTFCAAELQKSETSIWTSIKTGTVSFNRKIIHSLYIALSLADIGWHRCPEPRGACNPNQSHHQCPFTVPTRRSSMPEHRRFRMEKLGRNIKLYSFFPGAWGGGGGGGGGGVAATEKTITPILEPRSTISI